jgi:beta-carotene 15,15'-dioxygenase
LLYGAALALLHHYYALSETVQWVLFGSTMLLTGIPHGAIDHLVDSQNRLQQSKRFSLFKFLVHYLSKMALYALLWWFFPVLAFIVFMGISAFHFGETDLIALPKHSKSEKMLFWSYGWMLLSILLFTHKTEILLIINSLPSFLEPVAGALIALFGFYKNYYFVSCAILLLGASAYYHWHTAAGFGFTLMVLLQGIILLIICAKLPFLLAFSFYFGLWHSLLCLQSIRQYLQQNNQQLAWKELVRKATLFSSIAITGIVLLMAIGNQYSQASDLLLWLFIGIAILTAPHMEIMSTMFDAVRNSSKLPSAMPNSPITL